MRTAAEYLQKKPHARATTLANRQKVAEKLGQLKRETASGNRPTRKSIIERFLPWFGRRA